MTVKDQPTQDQPMLTETPRNPMDVDYGAEDDDACSVSPEEAPAEERIPIGVTPDADACELQTFRVERVSLLEMNSSRNSKMMQDVT